MPPPPLPVEQGHTGALNLYDPAIHKAISQSQRGQGMAIYPRTGTLPILPSFLDLLLYLGSSPVAPITGSSNSSNVFPPPFAQYGQMGGGGAMPMPCIASGGPTYANRAPDPFPQYAMGPWLSPQVIPSFQTPPIPAQGYTANHSQFNAQISRQRNKRTGVPARQAPQQALAPPPAVHEQTSVVVSLAYLKDKTHKLQNIGVRFLLSHNCLLLHLLCHNSIDSGRLYLWHRCKDWCPRPS